MRRNDALFIAAMRARHADADLRRLIKLDAHPTLIFNQTCELIRAWVELGYARAMYE